MNRYHITTYAHIKHNKLKKHQYCEDYSMHYADDHRLIACIGDGHGDPRCYRAYLGSKFACYSAMEVMKDVDIGKVSIEDVSAKIICLWKRKVMDHYKKNPTGKFHEDPFVVYGTTLCALMITDDLSVLINVGDSKCLYEDEDGFSSLIDKKSISPDSLSNSNVTAEIKILEKKPSCLMLMSDGGGKVKDEAEFLHQANLLFQHSKEKFHRAMLKYVDYCASDDDVTVLWISGERGECNE